MNGRVGTETHAYQGGVSSAQGGVWKGRVRDTGVSVETGAAGGKS